MRSLRGLFDRSTPSDDVTRFVWIRPLGFVRLRDVVRGGIVVAVLLIAVVTALTSDLVTLVALVLLALLALRSSAYLQDIAPERRIDVYADGGIYVAEHLGTGRVRHGESPAEALGSLTNVVDLEGGSAT